MRFKASFSTQQLAADVANFEFFNSFHLFHNTSAAIFLYPRKYVDAAP